MSFSYIRLEEQRDSIRMSDFYEDDSFESESDSESGEKEELERKDVADVQSQARESQPAPNLLWSPRFSAAFGANGSSSDLEEQDSSRLRPP